MAVGCLAMKVGYVKDGQTLPGNSKALERNKKRQKSPTVKLDVQQKEVANRTKIVKKRAEFGFWSTNRKT